MRHCLLYTQHSFTLSHSLELQQRRFGRSYQLLILLSLLLCYSMSLQLITRFINYKSCYDYISMSFNKPCFFLSSLSQDLISFTRFCHLSFSLSHSAFPRFLRFQSEGIGETWRFSSMEFSVQRLFRILKFILFFQIIILFKMEVCRFNLYFIPIL